MKNKKINKNKNNDTKKLLLSLGIVLLIIAIVGGATYAYWAWESDTTQKTNINVTVVGGTLTIVGDNISNTGIYPTSNCAGSGALVGAEVIISATNQTASNMTVTPRLDILLTPQSGRTLSADALSHLHWAVVDTSTTQTCANADYTGTFNKVAKVTVTKSAAGDVTVGGAQVESISANTNTTINVANINASNEVSSTLSFVATKSTTTEKSYRVYVWLDDGYEYTNSGSSVTDPMQQLGITVKWSPNSTMIQQ